MDSEKYTLFDPKKLASEKLLDFKLLDIEIEKDADDESSHDYIVRILFENIYHQDIFNEGIEKYFDNIYYNVLNETGLYLESIEILDEEVIFAWGSILKYDNNFYTTKPESFE
jgi:hypothetical protein